MSVPPQVEKLDEKGTTLVAHEGGLNFEVNLTDYADTGLFLDHRITRGMVRELAKDKRFLNLFSYTGSFTVYAAMTPAPISGRKRTRVTSPRRALPRRPNVL